MIQLMEGDDEMKKKQSVNQSVSQPIKTDPRKVEIVRKRGFEGLLDTGNARGQMINESVSKNEVKKS